MRMESRFNRRPLMRPVSRAGFQVPLAAQNRDAHERVEKLVALASTRSRPLVLTHDNPDPDCLASALALA